MTIVMIAGGIDLSVGYLASLGGIFVAKGIVDWGIPVVPAVILGILICIGLEAMLGAIIARLEVEPFIITLGGSIAFRGIALLMCQSREVVMQGQLEGFKTNPVSYTHLDVYKRQALRWSAAIRFPPYSLRS